MIIDLFNELCGARLTYFYMRVGGVKWDAPEGWLDKVRDFIPYMRDKLENIIALLVAMKFSCPELRVLGSMMHRQL